MVVVTYQNREHIIGCLDSLLDQVPQDGSKVVVFDNASADGTADLVESTYPGVAVVRSSSNLGFARACNQAAADVETDFVLLTNPDAVLQPRCLGALLALADRRPEVALVGGRTLRPNGDLDPMSCWGRPTLWSLVCFATGLSAAFPRSQVFNPEGLGRWARDTERQVDIVSGCLLLVRREAWQRLGGFDECFFMYGEDADLGIRARAAGYRSMITPEAEIIHLLGGSSPAVDKEVMLFRGKVTLLKKLWPGPAGSLAQALLLYGVWLRARPRPSCGTWWPSPRRRRGRRRARGRRCGHAARSGVGVGACRPDDQLPTRCPLGRHDGGLRYARRIERKWRSHGG